MKLRITLTSGPDASGVMAPRYLDRGAMTLGRGEDCDWTLPDPERTLSKSHCELAFQGNVYVLRDTSTNGVFVNGADRPLGRGTTAVLRHGDTFRVAEFRFRVDLVAGESGAVSAPPPETAPLPEQTATPRFVDPGSPLDSFAAPAAPVGDAFDAFTLPDASAAGNDAFGFGTDGNDDDWGRDDSESTGFGGSFGSESAGFGAFDLPAPPVGGAAIPDDFDAAFSAPADFSSKPATAETAFDSAPWDNPAPVGAVVQNDSLRVHAAILIETVLRLDRIVDGLGGLLDIPARPESPADSLPPASGGSLVDHLQTLPSGEAAALLNALGEGLIDRIELFTRTLAARPPASGSTTSPFEEDPFE